MKKHIFFVFVLMYAAGWVVAANTNNTFRKETPTRQFGKEEGMLLDLGKISMGTLNDVEEKKQYLSTVQLEKQRIQNYMLRMVYENAYTLYKQGDYQRAQEMAQTILSIDPEFTQAKTLARQAQDMGTYGTTSESQVIEAKFQEASSLYASGRLVEANDKVNEILTIQPGNSRAQSWKRKIDQEIAREYTRRGDEAEQNGDYRQALDDWYNALLMRKDDPKLVAKIADAENKLRKQQVEESMKQALDFYANGQFVESYAVFERITKIQPGDPRVEKYMAQLKNEIAEGYYNAGTKAYEDSRFDQAITYWNNAKKWGADETSMDGLIKQARAAKEDYTRTKRRMEAVAVQEAKAQLAAAQEAAKAEELPEPIETVTVDEPSAIPGVEPSAGTPVTVIPGSRPEVPVSAPGAGTSRVSAEASAASRAKYREGLDYYNQDDYENARASWTVAKQLDPGNTDAELGLRKVEELLK